MTLYRAGVFHHSCWGASCWLTYGGWACSYFGRTWSQYFGPHWCHSSPAHSVHMALYRVGVLPYSSCWAAHGLLAHFGCSYSLLTQFPAPHYCHSDHYRSVESQQSQPLPLPITLDECQLTQHYTNQTNLVEAAMFFKMSARTGE